MVIFDFQEQRKTRGFEKATLVKHDVFSVLNVKTSRNSALQASNIEEFDVSGLTLEVSSLKPSGLGGFREGDMRARSVPGAPAYQLLTQLLTQLSDRFLSKLLESGDFRPSKRT